MAVSWGNAECFDEGPETAGGCDYACAWRGASGKSLRESKARAHDQASRPRGRNTNGGLPGRPSRLVGLLGQARWGVHSRGLSATRRHAAVVELLVQVEHACGSCPMSLAWPVSSRVTWCRGCGL